MNIQQHEKDPLTEITQNLTSRTLKLKQLSNHIFTFLTISLLISALGYSLRSECCRGADARFILNIVSLILSLVGLWQLKSFNDVQKDGMAYYEEVSDELEWGQNRTEYQFKPSIEFRIALKKFLQATDLTFTAGKNGQLYYFTAYWLILFANIYCIGQH